MSAAEQSRRAGRDESVSLVQHAISAVTDHIRTHRLKVGESLPSEVHFAGALGVSRAVMREAFGALAALRVINVGNGRKPRVGAMDGSVIATSLDHAVNTAQITVPEVWDVRRTIEVRTAALAALSRTEKESALIIELARSMADAADLAAVTRFDIAFHEAIARASHNGLFVQIVGSFGSLMQVAVPTAWATRSTEADRSQVLENHMAVARAIQAREPEAAAAAMGAHFDTSIDDLLKGMWDKERGRA